MFLHAAKIRQYREAAGITQRDLGVMVGLSESAIRNFELGNRVPKREYLERIALALNVHPASLGVSYAPESPEKVMHILFEAQSWSGLHPVVVDGRVLIEPEAEGKVRELTYYVMKWDEKEREFAEGKISERDLELWKARFPKSLDHERTDGIISMVDYYSEVKKHVRRLDSER